MIEDKVYVVKTSHLEDGDLLVIQSSDIDKTLTDRLQEYFLETLNKKIKILVVY